MRILTVNPGSSSLKLDVVEDGRSTRLEATDVAQALEAAGTIDAAAVRVVHGGMELRRHARVDDRVVACIEAAADLAPLHNAQSLDAIRILREKRPDLPVIACLDTAWHSGMPAAARTYPLPQTWRDRWKLERLGFHGLSHESATWATSRLLQRPPDQLRIVTCHLGAGASLAADSRGVCVDTTMGFTPLEGLMMATRSGTVDPGMLVWLLTAQGVRAEEMGTALEHESGLQGVAGHADMPAVERAAAEGDAAAILAVDMYVHRLRGGIAAMAAAMNGLDAIAFTGGVGENAPSIRSATAAGLGFFGVQVDEERNRSGDEDRLISPPGAAVACAVVKCREEITMAAIAGAEITFENA